MSKTYRRRGNGKHRAFGSLKEHTRKCVRTEERFHWGYHYTWVQMDPSTHEYKYARAQYYGDFGTHNFKEPGPSWFRNLTNTRPLRQQARREIHKWMRDPDYEPLIDAMGYLEYWT